MTLPRYLRAPTPPLGFGPLPRLRSQTKPSRPPVTPQKIDCGLSDSEYTPTDYESSGDEYVPVPISRSRSKNIRRRKAQAPAGIKKDGKKIHAPGPQTGLGLHIAPDTIPAPSPATRYPLERKSPTYNRNAQSSSAGQDRKDNLSDALLSRLIEVESNAAQAEQALADRSRELALSQQNLIETQQALSNGNHELAQSQKTLSAVQHRMEKIIAQHNRLADNAHLSGIVRMDPSTFWEDVVVPAELQEELGEANARLVVGMDVISDRMEVLMATIGKLLREHEGRISGLEEQMSIISENSTHMVRTFNGFRHERDRGRDLERARWAEESRRQHSEIVTFGRLAAAATMRLGVS